MANPRKRVPENAPGDFFVDSTCIDCDTCRQIAPAVFGQASATSFVKAQPSAGFDRRVALRALLPCAADAPVLRAARQLQSRGYRQLALVTLAGLPS